MTREEQIEMTIDRIIDSWNTDTLANYARTAMLDYYLTRAHEDEQDLLLKHFDGEDTPSHGH